MDRFLQTELCDMKLEVEINKTYDSIYDTLMEYLKDEMDKVLIAMDENVSKVVKSWESMRLAGLKVESAIGNGVHSRCIETLLAFENIRRKWDMTV